MSTWFWRNRLLLGLVAAACLPVSAAIAWGFLASRGRPGLASVALVLHCIANTALYFAAIGWARAEATDA